VAVSKITVLAFLNSKLFDELLHSPKTTSWVLVARLGISPWHSQGQQYWAACAQSLEARKLSPPPSLASGNKTCDTWMQHCINNLMVATFLLSVSRVVASGGIGSAHTAAAAAPLRTEGDTIVAAAAPPRQNQHGPGGTRRADGASGCLLGRPGPLCSWPHLCAHSALHPADRVGAHFNVHTRRAPAPEAGGHGPVHAPGATGEPSSPLVKALGRIRDIHPFRVLARSYKTPHAAAAFHARQ
jgi:hypothetical protein